MAMLDCVNLFPAVGRQGKNSHPVCFTDELFRDVKILPCRFATCPGQPALMRSVPVAVTKQPLHFEHFVTAPYAVPDSQTTILFYYRGSLFVRGSDLLIDNVNFIKLLFGRFPVPLIDRALESVAQQMHFPRVFNPAGVGEHTLHYLAGH